MEIVKKILKWGGAAVLVLILGFIGYSEHLLTRAPDPVPVSLTLPTDEISLAEGERLAKTRGCFGCHGNDLGGAVFFDEPLFARMVSPNLTKILNSQPTEKLEAAIRQGIGMDGRPLVLMPSDMYSYLTDEDTAKILAFLKTFPLVEDDLPDTFFGPISRWFFIQGVFKTAPAYLEEAPSLQYASNSNPTLVEGEYLAMTLCSECHGLDLKGIDDGDFFTPGLIVASAYSSEEFKHLMKTGEATGGRELGLMAGVALGRFSYLTEEEVEALHVFLVERATRLMEESE